LQNCLGSSDENDENEHEDEDDPLVVIDKSKKSSFTRELAGLNRNLRTAWDAPAALHQRSNRTEHHRRSGSQLQMQRADGEGLVQAKALHLVLRIRCDFRDGILSFVSFVRIIILGELWPC
jgi:hypothetical protein